MAMSMTSISLWVRNLWAGSRPMADDGLEPLAGVDPFEWRKARREVAEVTGEVLPTVDLVTWFTTHKSCPDCGSLKFRMGPEGGMAVNTLCVGCHAEFNLCLPMFADRLAEPGKGRLRVYGLAEPTR